MAFPFTSGAATHKAVTLNKTGTNWTPINMPSTINSGDLLIAIVAMDGANETVGFSGGTGGWTKLADGSTWSDGTCTTAVAWRKADGSTDALSLTNSNEAGSAVVFRITGAADPTVTAPYINTANTGSSTNVNPNDIAPGAGAKDFLWFAFGVHDRNRVNDGQPSGYTSNVHEGSGSGGASLCYGYKTANAASDDPGPFTFTVADGFATGGLAIHPAPVASLDQEAFRFVDDDGDENNGTFSAALNTDITGDRDTVYRCRIQVSEVNGVAADADTFKPQKSINGGAWTDLLDTDTDVRSVLSGDAGYVDNDATTERLAGAGTFVAGEAIEGTAPVTGSITVGANQDTEIEFAFDCTGLLGSDYVDFRLTRVTGGALDSTTEIPRFTVASSAAQTVLRTTFGTPTNDLLTGTDKQKFRLYVRRDAQNDGTGTPTVDLFLYESGTQKQALATGISITSDSGQIIEDSWDAINLAAVSGANVELRAVGQVGGTGIQQRTVEFGAVEWCVEHAASGVTAALGTITVTGDLATNGEHTGVTATSTFTGDLAGTGLSLMYAVGTITITGDLGATGTTNAYGTITALGQGISEGTHNAFGVITFIGQLIAGGGVSFASGTITCTGDLAANGKTLSAGTASVAGDLASNGEHTGVTGTSTSTGDLAAIGTKLGGVVPALGTITFSATLDADGKNLAAGTSTTTGDLAAVGTTNASGTITALGQGLSEGTHLAAGTITATGDLAAVGIGLQSAVGTIAITGDLAADGKSLAGGTSTITGDLAAVGSRFFLAFGTSTITGDLAANGEHTGVTATSTSTGDLAAIGVDLTSNFKYGIGTITFSAEVAASGTQLAGGTSSFSGQLVAVGVALQPAVGTSTITGDLVSRGTTLARGTITALGQGLSEGTHLAAGTITAIGDLAATGIALQPVTATSTSTGDLAANGEHTGITGASTFSGDLAAIGTKILLTTPAFGTITITGELAADSQDVTRSATATITVFGSEDATGIGFVYAVGTITITGELPTAIGSYPATTGIGTILFKSSLDAYPIVRCPDGITASISIFGSLSAVEDPSDDIVTASGFINLSGSLNASLYHYADSGNLLARGTISFIGELSRAEIRKVSCIRPTGTITIVGGSLAAFGGDLNQKYKSATITWSATLNVSAIYARAEAIAISGSLSAAGRLLADGDLAMQGQASEFNTSGQIGAGTIDGQKLAIIREAYGSIELYNNSQGGFYSIGGGAAVKEAFGLINVTSSVDALGSVDQTKFALGSISVSGDLDTTEPITSVLGSIITGIGDLAASGDHTGVTATSTFSGDLAAAGELVVDLTLTNYTVHTITGSEPAYASYKVDADGNVYADEGSGYVLIFSADNWCRPVSEAGNYKIRATKTSGSDPTDGNALDTWLALTTDKFWANEKLSGKGSISSTLLLELSIDEVEILESASIVIIAQKTLF
jgi:hypothetical protein